VHGRHAGADGQGAQALEHTLFLIGPALDAHGTRSHLYHPGHFHGYRKADPEARKALRSRGARP